MLSRVNISAPLAALATALTVGALVPIAVAAPAPVITGRMVDLSGQPLAGVKVSLSGSGQSQADVTGADGIFRVAALSEDAFFNAQLVTDQGGIFPVAASNASLHDLRIDTTSDTQVGDVTIHRLTEVRTLKTVDTEGDPLPGAHVVTPPGGFHCLRRVERPDLPARAPWTVLNCSGWHPTFQGQRGDNAGELPIALPVGDEAAAASAMKIQVKDPASGDLYVVDFSEGVYDTATRTYTFTVEGTDAPPAKAPAAVQNLTFQYIDPSTGMPQMNWYWDGYSNNEQGRAPGTGYRIQVTGDRGTSTDEQVSGTDYPFYVLKEAEPGERLTVTVTVLSAAGPSAPTSFEFTAPSVQPSGLATPTVVVNHKRNTANISWSAPADDGGDPNFRYFVFIDGKRRGAGDALNLLAKRLRERKHTVYIYAYNSSWSVESERVSFKVK